MAEMILHETKLIGKPDDKGGSREQRYWQCSCGEVYPVGEKHSKLEYVQVILFKESGKYYTESYWRIPEGAILPYDMIRSPDFRRINGDGPVLIPAQEPWGFPHLFPKE